MCGKLVKSMYGTRDAARNWEMEYTGFRRDIGFQHGLASPCVFFHVERGIRVGATAMTSAPHCRPTVLIFVCSLNEESNLFC